MAKRGGFVRLVCPGQRVVTEKGDVREGWRFGGNLVLPGYHAERRVITVTSECIAVLKVYMSDEGRAVFYCGCGCEDSEHGFRHGLSAETVIKKYLVSCSSKSVGGKRWQGPDFFGFNRADVSTSVQEASQLPPLPFKDMREEYQSVCCQAAQPMSACAPGTGKTTDCVRWAGVVDLGEVVESPHWLIKQGRADDHVIYVRNGYTSRRELITTDGTVIVSCRVLMGDNEKPLFKCCWTTGDGEQKEVCSSVVNQAVRLLLSTLPCTSSRRWQYDGLRFFGLHLLKVKLSACAQNHDTQEFEGEEKATAGQASLHVSVSDLTQKLQGIQRRNAGPSSLLAKQHHDRRMDLCDQAVNLITFGDLRDYVKYLLSHHEAVIDEAIDSSPSVTQHLTKKLAEQTRPVIFTPAECGELLTGAHSLSERSYKNTRRILLSKNVYLSTYDSAVKYLTSLDIGCVMSTHEAHVEEGLGPCSQCFTWDLLDTLQRCCSIKEIFEKFKFPSEEQQLNLFEQLQDRRPDVYQRLDAEKRTIFLRQTGDNYRAALKRQPTQQMSVSVLNILDLVYSPLGQFVLSSWRGNECRKMLRAHMTTTFEQLDKLARQGITLNVPCQGGMVAEQFNVVVLYVSDFSHTKEVLGRVQVNSEQGCPACDRPASTWHTLDGTKGHPRRYKQLLELGAQAEAKLGTNPDKDSQAYKNWYKENEGQTGRPLLDCLCPETCPPCALHLHLSLHRCMWKMIAVIVKARDQEAILPEALQSIGCTYLAYQVQQYFASKKRSYDGSDTLKMTGVDCIRLEEQIEKFALFFVRPGQSFHGNDPACMELRHLVELFTLVREISKEMRALETTASRINAFRSNVQSLFRKLKQWAPAGCLSKVPYMHTLHDHVADIMEFWFKSVGWGYGYLSCMASEHLNKL